MNEKENWFSMSEGEEGGHLDIYLYGVIGGKGVNAQSFIKQLQEAGDVNTITVYINTVGGSFYAGLAIFNTLKQHKAVVTTRVMGYGLSIGSVIMLAGDRVEAAKNSLMMIHRANTKVGGDVSDLEKAIEILKKHELIMVPEYVERLKIDDAAVRKLLAIETWYTAEEAQEAGLIDVVIDEVELNPEVAAATAQSKQFVTENYKSVPRAFDVTGKALNVVCDRFL